MPQSILAGFRNECVLTFFLHSKKFIKKELKPDSHDLSFLKKKKLLKINFAQFNCC